MLYNIKIGKTLKKDKKGERGLHLIIYIHVREGKEKRRREQRRGAWISKKGVLFPLTGENVFTGRGIIWQREGRKTRMEKKIQQKSKRYIRLKTRLSAKNCIKIAQKTSK